MMRRLVKLLAAAVVMVARVSGTQAVDVQTVSVGNPGNPDDTHGDGYGRVDYVYNIGKFEVTAGQYTAFLNAVADQDTYGLYNTNMWDNELGCKIRRTGSPGSYAYLVDADGDGEEDADWTDRPVNYVSWGEAARFCNWLHNGQPTGAQDLTTTEDGSYYLNGATTNEQLMAIVREPDATWVIPSEDEWYKAAYHYNDGVTGNYYDYPTSSDTVPGYVNDSGDLSGTGTPFTEGGTDPGNYATYDGDGSTNGIGSPYYRTQVGEWENSDSPYGTSDQGGNAVEWTEAILYDLFRGVRGGSYVSSGDPGLDAASRGMNLPDFECDCVGFRVAEVPDCNDNGMPDPCDLDCGPTSGPCDVEGCGQSADDNADGIPDECGACCGPGPCVQVTQPVCENSDRLYRGNGTTCKQEHCDGIPAVSEWGMVTMALLVLTVGTLVWARRGAATV